MEEEKMTGILALDIETANYSHEIGGWDKTHLFEPTVVATWDGDTGTVYCNKALDSETLPKGTVVKALHPRTLGEDLTEFVEKGGRIVGHNIRHFDLPILRDALDCWAAGELLGKADCIIDTSTLLSKKRQYASDLGTLVKLTLSDHKTGTSMDAPMMWKDGCHDEVAAYCLKDAQLSHRLWAHGTENGIIKTRSKEDGSIMEIEVNWQ